MTVTAKKQTVKVQGNYNEFKQYLGFDKKFGYVNEFKKLKNSNTHVVRISVPLGTSKNPENMHYENFDLYIKPAEAFFVLDEYKDAIADDDVKVTARFACGNLRTKAWMIQTGERQGQVASGFGGNLTHLYSMKVDGVMVHGRGAEENTVEQNVDKETGEVMSGNQDDMASNGAESATSDTTQEGSASHRSEVPPVDAYDELDNDTPEQSKDADAAPQERGKRTRSKRTSAKR